MSADSRAKLNEKAIAFPTQLLKHPQVLPQLGAGQTLPMVMSLGRLRGRRRQRPMTQGKAELMGESGASWAGSMARRASAWSDSASFQAPAFTNS